jgi:copper chaperone CopZ
MELSDLEGVRSVQADLATRQVSVEFEVPATPDRIEQLLAEINYPVAK